MERINIKTCPVCGGKYLDRVLTCVDHCVSGESFYLCRCHDCGFLLTQDFPDETEIGRYYDFPDYISHTDTHKGLVNKLYHHVRAHMLKRKARLVETELHRQQGRLLDVGAGTGYFADTMRRRGWQVEATEKNAGARQTALERFGLHIRPAEDLQTFPDGSFEAITLWHVMEHLQPLNETWEQLHRLLADYGMLIVAVPNYTSADACRYGAYWAAYDVPRHLWHFAPATMQRLAAKHGFILASRYPMPFDAFYIAIQTERYMRRRGAFLRGCLSGLLAWLASLGHKDRSSSIIYVFRKQKRPAQPTAGGKTEETA